MRIKIEINPYGRKPAWANAAEAAAYLAIETAARAWLVRAEQALTVCAEIGDYEPFGLKDAITDAREWLAERQAERDSAARVAETEAEAVAARILGPDSDAPGA